MIKKSERKVIMYTVFSHTLFFEVIAVIFARFHCLSKRFFFPMADFLVDVFQFLEINEIEKCELVSKFWHFSVKDNKFRMSRRRRIQRLLINCIHINHRKGWDVNILKHFSKKI